MYQIDFNHPSSIYFVGIGGISIVVSQRSLRMPVFVSPAPTVPKAPLPKH